VSAREVALRKSIALGPGFAPARTALARLLGDAGRWEEARAAALEAVALEPGSLSAFQVLLEASSSLKRADETRLVESRLIAIVRTNPGALGTLVRHYESRQAPGEAEAFLKRVRSQSPRNLRIAHEHASFLDRQGRDEEAEVVLREALTLERKDATLLNSLAYLSAERGVKLAEALGLADEALKLSPGSAAILDTKGWVLFRLGRTQEAEDWLRRSLNEREDPLVREHLGDVLEKATRLPEALDSWRLALAHARLDENRRAGLVSKIEKAAAGLPKD
jgi:tetratricopeptide (TPR) repeat protein